MKLIKPSFEIWEQEPGLEGIYKQIEKAARVCYKSENNIKEDSAKKMVDTLIKNKHTAMLEHGTVYFKVPSGKMFRDAGFTLASPTVHTSNMYYEKNYIDGCHYITTNYRYIIENELEHWLIHLCEPTEYHEKRVTVKFTTSIGITRELIRHRKFSFANESTRYCNYSNDKFNRELTFIKPSWFDEQYSHEIIQNVIKDRDLCKHDKTSAFIKAMIDAENGYIFAIRELGLQAQEAREILPLATKSEIVMTGFVSDWKHFFWLRSQEATGKVHPDLLVLTRPLEQKFYELDYFGK